MELYNKQAEEAVIGSILLDPDYIEEVIDYLEPEDFYFKHTRLAFESILKLFQNGEPIDVVSVYEEVSKKNEQYALESVKTADNLPTAEHISHYAKIVKERSLTRRLKQMSKKIEEELSRGLDPDSVLNKAILDLEKLLNTDIKNEPQQAGDVVKSTLEHIVSLKEYRDTYGEISPVTGIPTGYKHLDIMTSGFHEGEYTIIAARPSVGKTALAISMALNTAVYNSIPTMFFSIEMPKHQIIQRMLSMISGIDLQKIRRGDLSVPDEIRLSTASIELSNAPLFVDDSYVTPQELRLKLLKYKRSHDIKIAFVDYLQLMRIPGMRESRQQEITEISRLLKLIAKDLGISMIVLSQLSRAVEQREDKRPRLSDLRESGAIEQDADVVMFLYRHEYYARSEFVENAHMAELIIGKQRNGPIGTVYLAFNPTTTAFLDIGA